MTHLRPATFEGDLSLHMKQSQAEFNFLHILHHHNPIFLQKKFVNNILFQSVSCREKKLADFWHMAALLVKLPVGKYTVHAEHQCCAAINND